ncbi:MAG: hypothetical protein LKK19_00950 [Bacteroidales bacterium]|nr:hypothetical protein [Bacteroidales bacterium]MCI2121254.1 hypothetical protein [Bacteroidales bacterium]MCI2146150.1 hypothetical protein [Bacteroidales bacterium]
MRNNLAISLLLFTVTVLSFGQEPYSLNETGKAREMAVYDGNGELTGYQVYEIVGKSRRNDTTIVEMSCYMLDENHEDKGFTPMKMNISVHEGNTTDYSFAGVIFQQCMGIITKYGSGLSQSGIAKSKITVTGNFGTIPAGMKAGDTLPDGTIKVNVAGIPITIGNYDRNVLGKKNLETPIGTYECMKMEETVSIRMFMVSKKMRIVSWYAPGVGEIRNETFLNGKEAGDPDEYAVLSYLR